MLFWAFLYLISVEIKFCRKYLISIQSNPYTSQLKWNWGKEAINFQFITTVLYHSKTLSLYSHYTFFLDCVLWCMYAYLISGWKFMCMIVIGAFLHALSTKDINFIYIVSVFWGVCASFAISLIHFYPFSSESLLFLVELFLIVDSQIRTFGHLKEKLPPYLFHFLHDKNFDKEKHEVWQPWSVYLPILYTRPFSFVWKILCVVFSGWVTEFVSGFFYRLINIFVYMVYIGESHKTGGLLNIHQARKEANKIRNNGWKANVVSLKLFSEFEVFKDKYLKV